MSDLEVGWKNSGNIPSMPMLESTIFEDGSKMVAEAEMTKKRS